MISGKQAIKPKTEGSSSGSNILQSPYHSLEQHIPSDISRKKSMHAKLNISFKQCKVYTHTKSI